MTVTLHSKCKDEDDVSASSDSLGEQLFELVDVFNTGHSQKITGKQPYLWFNTHSILCIKYQWDTRQLISNLIMFSSGQTLIQIFIFLTNQRKVPLVAQANLQMYRMLASATSLLIVLPYYYYYFKLKPDKLWTWLRFSVFMQIKVWATTDYCVEVCFSDHKQECF